MKETAKVIKITERTKSGKDLYRELFQAMRTKKDPSSAAVKATEFCQAIEGQPSVCIEFDSRTLTLPSYTDFIAQILIDSPTLNYLCMTNSVYYCEPPTRLISSAMTILAKSATLHTLDIRGCKLKGTSVEVAKKITESFSLKKVIMDCPFNDQDTIEKIFEQRNYEMEIFDKSNYEMGGILTVLTEILKDSDTLGMNLLMESIDDVVSIIGEYSVVDSIDLELYLSD